MKRKASSWEDYIKGNMTKEVRLTLDQGCSLTVAFHGINKETGTINDMNRRVGIQEIIEMIKTAVRRSSSTCKCVKSITLISCFGGTNGNAKAIADATGLPVVAACGEGVVYPVQRYNGGPIGFFIDDVKAGIYYRKMTAEDRLHFVKNPFATYSNNPSNQWEVVQPAKRSANKR